ncbi:hypothetical protein A2872_01775 [Candidatus Gottesmanbacteria bacterium RIFCSPHIGHO2_01_FULL_42_12]|uniref:Response regulatory domain-containing protein n=1 Tax=Candidatus Gottesmanbacteria bacterium RIFCSPHIGHO2_01_FULL_42_12 TaxID=1798377 RepID=A0A1F5Z5E3_9BACT|nr:MAG: hypothetical protein A2872_01775 [Candidatus Gottesmanbacteria bacterium RIFCSPHIGHO2_01_FULL_42_12]
MPKKVLIIDDDLYIRDLYSEILSEDGYEVETAVDGIDGLERIAKTKFDLILLDLMMPRLDGLGVLRQIKVEPQKYLYGTIIILTNLANDPVIGVTQGMGAQSYIIKSDLNPDQFLYFIKSRLS